MFYIYQIQKNLRLFLDKNLSQFMILTLWIEAFHRAIKQVCGICRFMVRNTQAIKTHIFWRTRFSSFAPEREMSVSLQVFVCLEKMRSTNSISNWYQLQRNLFTLVIREYILLSNLPDTLAV